MSNEIFKVSYLQYHIRLAEPTKVFLFGIRFRYAGKDERWSSGSFNRNFITVGARWSYGGQRGIHQ
jgi:hypothetical protein